MTPTNDTPLALLSAAVGARRVCLLQLDAVKAAADGLASGVDPEGEALHGFRVAVRRLRSLLRAYRVVLDDTVRDRTRHRLRDLARATNAARDLEVQWERLRQAGETTVAQAWSGRVEEARAEAAGTVLPKFRRLERRLREELSTRVVRLDDVSEGGVHSRFALFNAGLVASQHAEFDFELATIGGVEDVRGQHAARIEGKKLRYLVEPWRESLPESRPLLTSCKRMQDVLGALHDVAVWLEVLQVDAPPLTEEVRARLRIVAREERARLYDEVNRWHHDGTRASSSRESETFVAALLRASA